MSRGKTKDKRAQSSPMRDIVGTKLPTIDSDDIDNWRGWNSTMAKSLPKNISAKALPGYLGPHSSLRAVNPSEAWFMILLNKLDLKFWWEPTLFSWSVKTGDLQNPTKPGGFRPDVYLSEENLRIELTVNNDWLPGLAKKRAKVQIAANHFPDVRMALFEAEDFVALSKMADAGKLNKESFLKYAKTKVKPPQAEFTPIEIKTSCETRGERPMMQAPTKTASHTANRKIGDFAKEHGWNTSEDYLELTYAHYAVGRLIPKLIEDGTLDLDHASKLRKKFRRHIRGIKGVTMQNLINLGKEQGHGFGSILLQERARMKMQSSLSNGK